MGRLLDKKMNGIYDRWKKEDLSRRNRCTEKNGCEFRIYKNSKNICQYEKNTNNRPHYHPHNSYDIQYIYQSFGEEYNPHRFKENGFQLDFRRKKNKNLRNVFGIKNNYVEGTAFIRR